MNILLPSAGVTGKKFINMKMATYKVMKTIDDEEPVDDKQKNEFIRSLTTGSIDHITSWDRDYLYLIAIAAMRENKLDYPNMECTCGSKHKYTLDISQIDVFDLPEGTQLRTPLEHNGQTWLFKISQVCDEEFAFDLCLEFLGEFDQILYDNIVLCRNLSSDKWEPDYSSLDNLVNSIKNLPQNIYMTAHAFKLQSFHGVPTVVDVPCPACGKKEKETLYNPGNIVSMSGKTLMELYTPISNIINYSEFLEMTVVEHLSLIQKLNQDNG